MCSFYNIMFFQNYVELAKKWFQTETDDNIWIGQD